MSLRGSIPSLANPLSTLRGRRHRRYLTHDSGPVRFATPSLRGTCTHYSLPVSRRTQRDLSNAALRWPWEGVLTPFVFGAWVAPMRRHFPRQSLVELALQVG